MVPLKVSGGWNYNRTAATFLVGLVGNVSGVPSRVRAGRKGYRLAILGRMDFSALTFGERDVQLQCI